MIGYMIPAFRNVQKRRLIKAPKFYFFDVGIVNYLCNRRKLQPGSADFGHGFEHLIAQEMIAFLSYSHSRKMLSYWRTASDYEVDIVYGDAEVAIEIKSSTEINSKHLKGLKAFSEEHPNARTIIVSLDSAYRRMNDIEIWPVDQFLKALWQNEILR